MAADHRISAQYLRDLAARLQAAADTVSCAEPQLDDVPPLQDFARRLYVARQRCNRIFEDTPMDQAAWAMLVDLYAAGPDSEHSTGSVCLSAGVPQTTALRRLNDLIAYGLVARKRNDRDNRVTRVVLTADGRRKMARCMTETIGVLLT